MVERALTAKGDEQQIYHENAARRESRRATQAAVGSQRGRGPSDQKRKVLDSVRSVGDKKQKSDSNQRQSRSGNWRDYPFCERCRRRHLGEFKMKICYQCGSLDHIKRNCSQLVKDEKKAADSFTPSKVFTLTQSEASDSKTVVTGQISSAGTMLNVLFDLGATHSFVSTKVIDGLCQPSTKLDKGVHTILPCGDKVISRRGIRALPVIVEGRECNTLSSHGRILREFTKIS